MKLNLKNGLFITLVLFSSVACNKTVSTVDSRAYSEKKALLDADAKKGIRLSAAAQKKLDLKFIAVTDQSFQIVPTSALVYFQDKTGFYRYRNGYFKLIEIDIHVDLGTEVKIRSNEIVPGDKIVTHGVPLLRVAELDAFAGPGDAE